MTKIDVAVNAPEAGTIKEFLASEEDTVTVGQDLVRIELGGAPAGGKEEAVASKEQAKEEPKAESKVAQEPAKTENKTQKNETSAAPEPKQAEKPATSKPTPKETQPHSAPAPAGSREERRVG
jgi:2-oxoglutarate dehydrogenase E2 component (dihydrolipoamide succinyltransferase)